MSFVSYAQNFEDVMLWRALKHVENGFYIDVGANDPTIESVTKAFYERGWNGINIEPLESHFNDLSRERPKDINIQCAVGESTGEIEVWEYDVRGWATASTTVIERYQSDGYEGVTHKVPVASLTDICEQHVKGEVHFLKVDVEGLEKSVILGMEFSRFRPWILVIEATKPNSVEESYEEWEEIILSANYTFSYADGLNRFYVSDEHDELLTSLKYPPNVFDGFVRSDQLRSELQAQQAEAKTQQAEAKAQQAEAKAQQAEAKTQQAEDKVQKAEKRAELSDIKVQKAQAKARQTKIWTEQAEAKAQEAERRAGHAETKAQQAESQVGQSEATLTAIYNSRLWRITAPWRWAGNLVRWFVRGSIAWLTFAPGSRARRTLRSVLIFIKSGISAHPLLKTVVAGLLVPFPNLDMRLRSVENSSPAGRSTLFSSMENEIEGGEDLSPRAQKIYSDIKTAIEQRQKEQR